MKRYICLAAMAAGVLFGATSCDGLFSDAPIDKLSGVNVWGDRLLLDEYENSWYRNMSNGFSIYMPTNGLVKSLGRDYPAWYTDQMTVSKTTWSSTSYGDILKSSDEEIYKRAYQYWNACYGQLRSINTLLDHAGEITTPTRDRVLGEAHFMRAYYYYLLLRRYGGVLLVDREYNTLNDPARFPRASYDEMVDFIVADADEAARLLPRQHESADAGRATKGAALMLKAKTYLWAASPMFQERDTAWLGFKGDRSREMLAKAKAAYDEVTALGLYSLVPLEGSTQDEIKDSYRKIFLTKNSAESIFEVQHNNDGNYAAGWGHKLDRDAASPYFGGTDCAYVPTQNHVDEYGMRQGQPDPARPYDNRDYRFYANVLYDGCTYRGHVMDIHYRVEGGREVPGADLKPYGTSETAAVTVTGYYMGKFVNPATEINNDPTYASSQNYIIWRYAELLLDYAEIELRLGNAAAALQKVNQVRQRAKMPPLAALTWDAYANERRVEMAFEETVYWDMYRWGTAMDKMNGGTTPLMGVKIVEQEGKPTRYTYGRVNRYPKRVRVFRPRQFYWPLPWDEVRYQRIEQNPEWVEL